MAAYFLVDVREIKDAAKMEDYRARVGPVVEQWRRPFRTPFSWKARLQVADSGKGRGMFTPELTHHTRS